MEFSFKKDKFETFRFQSCFTNDELREWITMKNYTRFSSDPLLFEKIQFETSSIPVELYYLDNEINNNKTKNLDQIIEVYNNERPKSIRELISKFLDKLSPDKKKEFKNGIALMKLDIPVNQLPTEFPLFSIQDQIMFYDNQDCIKALGRLYYNELLHVSKVDKKDAEEDYLINFVTSSNYDLSVSDIGTITEKYIIKSIKSKSECNFDSIQKLVWDNSKIVHGEYSNLCLNDISTKDFKTYSDLKLYDFNLNSNKMFVPIAQNFKALDFIIFDSKNKTLWCFQVTLGASHSNIFKDQNIGEIIKNNVNVKVNIEFVWIATSKLKMDKKFAGQHIQYIDDLNSQIFPLFNNRFLKKINK